MRVAVCCPGNSLPRRWDPAHTFDAVWAVNRALLVVKADWLSAGDRPMFFGLAGDHRPTIGVLTMLDTASEAKHEPTWKHLRFTGWHECPSIQRHKEKYRPIDWSVQAAMCHAVDVGAREITLFGCDFGEGGPDDCTGYVGEDRGPERWRREREGMAATISFMSDIGVSVTRILP